MRFAQCLQGSRNTGDTAPFRGLTVVGYASKDADQVEFAGISFIQVGGSEAMTYKDFIVNCDEEGTVGDGWQALGDGIVELDPIGDFSRKIVYLPKWYAELLTDGFGRTVQPGWYDEEENIEDPEVGFLHCLNDEPITFGHALQVNVPGGVGFGAKVSSNGQVKDGPTVIDVDQVMAVANCAPKKLYLKDFIVNCDEEGTVGDGWQALGDGIVELDPIGDFSRKIIYLPKWYAELLTDGFGRTVQPGWYDEEENIEDPEIGFLNCLNESEDHAIQIGGGVQVNVPGGAGFGATVTIKSALATEE